MFAFIFLTVDGGVYSNYPNWAHMSIAVLIIKNRMIPKITNSHFHIIRMSSYHCSDKVGIQINNDNQFAFSDNSHIQLPLF